MAVKQIHIDLGSYFTFNLKIFGYMIIMFSVSIPIRLEVGVAFYLIFPLIILAGLGLITARRKIILNLDYKYFYEYVSILWLKNGSKISFEEVEMIYVNKILTSGSFQSRGRSLAIKGIIYKAFLLFSDDNNIRLDEDKDKDKLMKRIAKYNQIINTKIQDNTSH